MDKDNIKAYVNKALIKTYIGEALVKADDNFVNEYSVNIKAYFAEAIIKAQNLHRHQHLNQRSRLAI